MNEKDPARLVFEGKPGKAIVVSLIDMGGRLRLICQDIECVKPILPMPNLPVARIMWKALPDLTTGVECWITAGGAHHTVLSYDVTIEQMHSKALRGFFDFPIVFSLFSGFPFYTYYNKEDFHYAHHYRHRPRGCCDILLFILPAAVSRLHRNGSSALIPPAGRILSRPSPQSTHGWTRYAHCCKIYLVQMKSNIQCDFECDFLLYLRTLPFNLTV